MVSRGSSVLSCTTCPHGLPGEKEGWEIPEAGLNPVAYSEDNEAQNYTIYSAMSWMTSDRAELSDFWNENTDHEDSFQDILYTAIAVRALKTMNEERKKERKRKQMTIKSVMNVYLFHQRKGGPFT